MARELTKKEVRKRFLEQIRVYVDYWEHEPRTPDIHGKLDGLVFSILNILDGTTNLPGFAVIPVPHETDKDYRIERGEDWYPPDNLPDDACDIVYDKEDGYLHDSWCNPKS